MSGADQFPVEGYPGRETLVSEVSVPQRALAKLEPLIGEERYLELQEAAAEARSLLGGRTFWNVSSTAAGGGVAEMLQGLVGYTLDAGLRVEWLVIQGDPEFFTITKRIHNRVHGAPGDGGPLGAAEAHKYEAVLRANGAELVRKVRRGDVVLLHDPQTAGLARQLADAGAIVVWRCHIGHDTADDRTEEAWWFLRPYLDACDAHVFSLHRYAPEWIAEDRLWVIPPSLDPFSPKNQELGRDEVVHILQKIGILASDGSDSHPLGFVRRDGTTGHVERRASILASEGSPLGAGDPMVIQVSRWDRLKDMQGVMEGFASRVVGRVDAHLALVGPSTGEVSDDPEGADVVAECIAAWEGLPLQTRARVMLVTLPMQDVDENAAMVNALQRHASVVVQKSLAEGFGLTVAEAMWKARPVVASAVGGIVEQVEPGTGILLADPTDLVAFGDEVASLLENPEEALALGARARRHVLDGYVGDMHLVRYAHLLQKLCST